LPAVPMQACRRPRTARRHAWRRSIRSTRRRAAGRQRTGRRSNGGACQRSTRSPGGLNPVRCGDVRLLTGHHAHGGTASGLRVIRDGDAWSAGRRRPRRSSLTTRVRRESAGADLASEAEPAEEHSPGFRLPVHRSADRRARNPSITTADHSIGTTVARVPVRPADVRARSRRPEKVGSRLGDRSSIEGSPGRALDTCGIARRRATARRRPCVERGSRAEWSASPRREFLERDSIGS
jgi:hypothetical protein